MAVRFKFNFPKAKNALLYIAQQELPEFTKGKACKLTFLVDKHHLVRYGRPVTGDAYCALEHGPVPSRLLDLLDAVEAGNLQSDEIRELAAAFSLDRRFVYPRLRPVERPRIENLSESDIESINDTIREHGRKSFAELRALTHEIPAYKTAWGARTLGSVPMQFEQFFDEDESALVGTKEEMIENDRLRAAFPEPAWL
jgi:uncharacterized phage-associated protein